MVTATFTPAPPAPPPPEATITLEMPLDVASSLQSILGKVAGDTRFTYRRDTDALLIPLEKALLSAGRTYSFVIQERFSGKLDAGVLPRLEGGL